MTMVCKTCKKVDCYPEDEFMSGGDCNVLVVTPDDGHDDDNKGKPCSNPVGVPCPETDHCYPWQLTEEQSEACAIEDYIEESLAIGAAVVNVHKMLGIYEQTRLVDEVGVGEAIASSEHPNFPSENAFDYYDTEWRSLETGEDVIKTAYIGYDFGPIRLDNGRVRHGIKTYVKKNIATVQIKQGCDAKNRVTRVRVERSLDGDKWYGSSILALPDCDGLVTMKFSASSPMRYWRLRPLEFNGGENDPWVVKALILSEHESTDIHNIQDRIFLENRDRKYSKEPIRTKASYTPVDYQGFLSKFGFNSPFNTEQYMLEFSFQQVIRLIGRPLVIGDILQLPSETFYTPKLRGTLKFLEITNVSWASTGFTPQWVPTILRVIAEPAMASEETQDIFGDLTEITDSAGTSDINDGVRNKKYQDVHDIAQTIDSDANTQVPQKGQDYANVAKLSDELRDWIDGNFPHGKEIADNLDRKRFAWGVDALPPNGELYTEGDSFPNNPKNGDYHRLTYLNVDRNLPPRLYRFSDVKSKWIYLETDMRYTRTETKPMLSSFLEPPRDDFDDRRDIDKIEDGDD